MLQQYAWVSEHFPSQGIYSCHSAACAALVGARAHSCSYILFQFGPCSDQLPRIGRLSLCAALEDLSVSWGGTQQYLRTSEQFPCQGTFSFPSAACTALAEAGAHSCRAICSFSLGLAANSFHALDVSAYVLLSNTPARQGALHSLAICVCQRTIPMSGSVQIT